MAIIRIKRTITTNLPSGLTFGELAFVQGSGATANRLYIQTNDAGVSVWIGAEILKSPTYWSGTTAETTVPTVSAVQSFVNAFVGATVFTSNITANLGASKSFGKYTNGQEVPLAGKTPIEAILDALVEYLLLDVSIQNNTVTGPGVDGKIDYGDSGSKSLSMTLLYTIKSAGLTALGATLEWQKAANVATAIANPGGWSTSGIVNPNSYYDTTEPYLGKDQQYLNTINTNQTITQWDTTPYHYRYTVRDSGGVGVSYGTLGMQAFLAPTATISTTGVTGTVTITDVHKGEIGTRREMGNTATSVTATIATGSGMNITYHKIDQIAMQYSVNNGSTWYSTTNVVDGQNWVTVSPQVGSTTSTFIVTPSVSGVTSMRFRFYAKEGATFTAGNTVLVLNSNVINSSNYVSFRKRIFYGATATSPSTWTATDVRTLPSSFLGPTMGTAIAAGSAQGQFTMNTGNQYKNFVIALPRGLTLNDFVNSGSGSHPGVKSGGGEVIFGKQTPSNDACQLTTLTQAPDYMGTLHNYNIYSWSTGDTYDNETMTINFNGTVNA